MIFFSPYKFDALFASAADADNLSQLNYMGVRRDGSVMEAPVLRWLRQFMSSMHIGQQTQTRTNLQATRTLRSLAGIGCFLLLNSPRDASVEADFRYLLNGL